MVRIIVSVILLVLLAVFVSLNIGYTTSVNLFGARVFDSVSIVAISALSFAFGIVYSFFMYLGSFLRRKAKRELANKGRDMKAREKQLDNRDADKERIADLVSTAESQKPTATP
ncbi:MAG: LapA family protein [Spirochaetales bacterium]|jgi:uncharacterized integral membrane protein